VLFSTYGDPDTTDSGHLMILGPTARCCTTSPCPIRAQRQRQRRAGGTDRRRPDGDGQLEIFVQTFDHGMDVFTVPGSGCDCLLWTTARGGPLRMGQPSAME
jgi:hypothetical protein